jgi:hypothetical protein
MVTGPCIPVNTQEATEFGSVGEESYGTAPSALPPIDIKGLCRAGALAG